MDYNSQEAPGSALPTTKAPGNAVSSPVRRSVNTFVCDADGCGAAAAGSKLLLAGIPAGARGVRHRVTVSGTLATTTLEIGTDADAAKYAAAATYTTADTPVEHTKAAHLAAELADDEAQFVTTGVAALPNDGTIIAVETEYTLN
jgi:hypothetical protein